MKSLGARRGSLPLLALLAGALTSGCWIALGIEDLSSDGLGTSTNGGGGAGGGGGGSFSFVS